MPTTIRQSGYTAMLILSLESHRHLHVVMVGFDLVSREPSQPMVVVEVHADSEFAAFDLEYTAACSLASSGTATWPRIYRFSAAQVLTSHGARSPFGIESWQAGHWSRH